MANTLLQNLPAQTTPGSSDLLYLVDGGTNTSQKVTYANLIALLATLSTAQSLSNKDLTAGTNTFPTSLATLTGVQVLSNKDLTAGTNTFPTSLVTLTGAQVLSNKTLTSPVFNTGVSGTAIDTDGTLAGNSDTKVASEKATKTYVDTTNLLSTTKYAPEGFLINGKLVISVASNNITVAIKGMDGTDPSASNKVYCRIGDTVRTISGALSVTKNAGTNWMNLGAAETATQDADLFAYLGYNATDGVVLGFSRIPYARQYSDFSVTTTNDRYAAISTITTAAATDYYELVGRFAATLSATASFNWSVPAYTALNLIQRPIYNTRWLTWVIGFTGFSANPTGYIASYMLNARQCFIKIYMPNSGTSNAAGFTETLPITSANDSADTYINGTGVIDNSATTTQTPVFDVSPNSATATLYVAQNFAGWTSSGTKRVSGVNGMYPL